MKRCYRCRTSKPADEFGVDRTRSDGLNAKCRACCRAVHHENAAKDPEGFRAATRKRMREYRSKDPDRARRIQRTSELQRLYGITLEDVASMMDAQDGRCAICRRPEPRADRSTLCVDHDHATGRVRGLLCDSCNTGLARFQDDPSVLRSAADYLSAAFARR